MSVIDSLTERFWARWYGFRCRRGWHPKDYFETQTGWVHVPGINSYWIDRDRCDLCGLTLRDDSQRTWPEVIYTTGNAPS